MREIVQLNSKIAMPRYSQADAAGILRIPRATISRWVSGYQTSASSTQKPLVSVSDRQSYRLSFANLTEIYVIDAFRKHGLSMHKIRETVEVLKRDIGIEHALAAQSLMTDGVEILYKLPDSKELSLVVVRNGQAVFTTVVEQFLKNIDYNEGFAEQLNLSTGLIVNPDINFGQATIPKYGIRIADVMGRVHAGESLEEVSYDFEIPEDELSKVLLAAA
ncbi:MAG: DUF433 domain-containing protein [Microbacteriaceae bacterium]